MSQTFPVSVAAFPFRCAGSTPAAISLDQSHRISAPIGPLMRSERPPKCLLHSPDLACVQTCRWHRASVAPTIEIGADIKSP